MDANLKEIPQVNDDPRVPPDVMTPSISELKKLCYKHLITTLPDDADSFVYGFYIGAYAAMGKPLPLYVDVNFRVGRPARLIDSGE